jgi:hypothetical protein
MFSHSGIEAAPLDVIRPAFLALAVGTLEIIEEYPHDKYLPSFLTRGESPDYSMRSLQQT